MEEKNNQYGLSRQIPPAVKREAARRCGFGCVVCGCGIIQYEHLTPPFAEAKMHDPDGITLLCADCAARRATESSFGERLAACHRNPKNKIHGSAGTLRDITAEDPVVTMGANWFAGVAHLMVIDDEAVLSFRPRQEAGAPLRVTVQFFGEDGGTLLKITDNEWIDADDGWDIEANGPTYTFRHVARDLVLSFTLHPPDTIDVHAFRFKKNGCVLDANAESVRFSEATGKTYVIFGNLINRSIVGLHLVTDERRSTAFVDTVADMTEEDLRDCRYLIQPAAFDEDD